jgi:hypothetical protein
MHKLLRILSIVAFFTITSAHYLAQGCSQCKAQIESSEENGLTVGNGLNYGITMLMITPYILLLSIPLIIYRKRFFRFLKDFAGLWKS